MKRQLHLYWFSGSGNTYLVASAFAERLRQRDWTVELRALERSDPQMIDPAAMLGLAFPTHFFAIPEIVLSFVRSLLRACGTESMMLGTHGVFSGGVVGPMKRELSAKGFRCIAARILSMPDSFYPLTPDRFNRWLISRALRKAEHYADDLATGAVCWTRWAILSDLHAAIFGGFFAARKLTRNHFSTIHAKNNQCKRCDICVNLCPMRSLKREADVPPRPQKNCTNCLRCVALCPNNSMRHMVGFRPYRCEEATAQKHRFEQAIGKDVE
jgi:NAD-dependent dihydropyrimidine dehydrogenase PreA subunit